MAPNVSNRLTHLFGILVLLLISAGTLGIAPVQEAPPITYLRYDVVIDVQQDGSFLVREIQQIRFGDVFRTAFAEIPTQYTQSIQDVRVYEDQVPYAERAGEEAGTYSLSREGDSLFIDWRYEPTEAGDVRTFTIEYRVLGGLWIYPDGDLLEWRAVPADRSGIPVQESQVTVTLPEPVAADALTYTAYGPDFDATATADQVVFAATEPVPDGTRFQVQVGFPPQIVDAKPAAWQIREDQADLAYRRPSLDVDLFIEPDGTVRVVETHAVAVEAGALYEGSRTLNLSYLDGIGAIQLWEGDVPFTESRSNCEYCLRIDRRAANPNWIRYSREENAVVFDESLAGRAHVAWFFPPLVKGEATAFRLSYQAQGAVQVLDDGQRINWTAVFSDREVAVASSALTVHLPPGLSVEDVGIKGGDVRVQADGTALVSHAGPIPPGQSWRVSLNLPANATAAQKPNWQQRAETVLQAGQSAAVHTARLQVAFATSAVLLLVVGVAALYLVWYRWGRDRPVAVLADYLPEPPSDLPPGIVAFLLDERATRKGVLASLFQLATLGLLAIEFTDSLNLRRTSSHDEPIAGSVQPLQADGQSVGAEKTAIPGHLALLYNRMLPALPAGQTVPFARVQPHFARALPLIYSEMGNEARRYFDTLPKTARRRWWTIGLALIALGIAVALVLAMQFGRAIGWLAAAPTFSLGLVGLGLTLVSRWMPRRTDAGAEEAQRWLAFKRYLKNLKKYASQEKAQEILDRYFAYAVALDVEEVVLAQAAALDTRIPDWTFGPGWPRPVLSTPGLPETRAAGQRLPQGGRLGDAQAPPVSQSRPSLKEYTRSMNRSLNSASQELGRSLSQGSAALGQALSTAAGTPTPKTIEVIGRDAAQSEAWKAAGTALDVLGTILEAAASSGGGRFGGSSRRRPGSGLSGSRSRNRPSHTSSRRSSASRRSGGGGRRGFGR